MHFFETSNILFLAFILLELFFSQSDTLYFGVNLAGGPWWGDYSLSIEPKGGVDKKQMQVVQKYPHVKNNYK